MFAEPAAWIDEAIRLSMSIALQAIKYTTIT